MAAFFLLFIAVFFFWYGFFEISIVCFALAVYFSFTKEISGFSDEIWKDLEETPGQMPDKGIWEDGAKVAATKTSELLFSDNDKVTRLKSIRVTKTKFRQDKIGEAAKKTGDLFKKLFG